MDSLTGINSFSKRFDKSKEKSSSLETALAPKPKRTKSQAKSPTSDSTGTGIFLKPKRSYPKESPTFSFNKNKANE